MRKYYGKEIGILQSVQIIQFDLVDALQQFGSNVVKRN